jgi:hypothetical protein
VRTVLLDRLADDDRAVASAVLTSEALLTHVPAPELAAAVLRRLDSTSAGLPSRQLLAVLAKLVPALERGSTERLGAERVLLPRLLAVPPQVRRPTRWQRDGTFLGLAVVTYPLCVWQALRQARQLGTVMAEAVRATPPETAGRLTALAQLVPGPAHDVDDNDAWNRHVVYLLATALVDAVPAVDDTTGDAWSAWLTDVDVYLAEAARGAHNDTDPDVPRLAALALSVLATMWLKLPAAVHRHVHGRVSASWLPVLARVWARVASGRADGSTVAAAVPALWTWATAAAVTVRRMRPMARPTCPTDLAS